MSAQIAAILAPDAATASVLQGITDHVARLRQSDPAIGWNVERGSYQLCRVTKAGRRTVVEPLTDRLPASDLLTIVEGMS